MKRLFLWLALMIVFSGAVEASEVCWSIGKADDDYREFAIAGNFAAYPKEFPEDVTYVVGESSPGEDWPYIQPSQADAWAGHRTHPFKVVFNLAERPPGDCLLTVDLINMHPQAPALQITINGHSTRFNLPAGVDNPAPQPGQNVKAHAVQVPFASSLLEKGKNTVTLATEQGSWVLYDALMLKTGLKRGTTGDIGDFKVQPTILFVERDGQLRRVVQTVIDNRGKAASGTVTVKAGAEEISNDLEHIQFGRHPYHVAVPPVDMEQDIRATLKVGDQELTAQTTMSPARKWRVYVAPSAHTDIGYTHIQDEVVKIHNQNTNTAIEACKEMPGFVWNLETSWQAQIFLKNQPRDRRQELLSLARKGKFGVQSIYLNMLTGLCSHEELNRLCYLSGRLKRAYDIPMDSGQLTDVPTAMWTMPTVLASSGVKYYGQGMNQTRGPFLTHTRDQLHNAPFWWQGPDGSKVLTWFTDSYAHAYRVGLREGYKSVYRRLPEYLAPFRNADYPYDAVFVYGACFDNRPMDPAYARIAAEWNEKWVYPKIILSETADFFRYVEKNFADQIPTVSGGTGAYWEDGAASSAKHTALNRRTHEKIVAAEKLHSAASILGLSEDYPLREFQQAWEDMLLYDEHTWGAHNSVSQPELDFVKKQWEIKSSFAEKAAERTSRLLKDGWQAISAGIKTGKNPTVAVFNPLSWRRTDIAESKLPDSLANTNFALVEVSTGEPLPYHSVDPGRIRFLAANVPSMGYKVYKLVQDRSPDDTGQKVRVNPRKHTMENRFYRITFDDKNGALESIYDKELNRELLQQDGPYGGNQYIYVSGGNGSRIVHSRGERPAPELTLHGPEGAKFSAANGGPVSGSMVVEAAAHMTPKIKTTVTLYSDLKRIDIVNELTKEKTYDKEAVYFAFPFAAQDPTVALEIPDGVLRPQEDQIEGACRDWYCVQRWASVTGDSHRVAWSSPDAPLVCLGDINRGEWKKDINLEDGSLFSYTMNNYWFTNYKAGQGGDFTFRYAITSGKPGGQPRHFGWNYCSPLLTAALPAAQDGKLPAEGTSFCRAKPDTLNILTVKRAEDERGWILRLQQTGDRDTTATITLPHFQPKKAWLCNMIEENQKELAVDGHTVRAPVKGKGIATVRVQ